MSRYHYVFVHPGHPHDRLISDISWACGVPLGPAEDEFIDYSANLGHAAIEVELSHEYEEDRGMAFGRYESLFTVRDFGSNLARQGALAHELCTRLASLERYSLLLTLDLQQFVEATSPAPGV